MEKSIYDDKVDEFFKEIIYYIKFMYRSQQISFVFLKVKLILYFCLVKQNLWIWNTKITSVRH